MKTEGRDIDESNVLAFAAFASAFIRGTGLIGGLFRKSLEWASIERNVLIASTHWSSVLEFAVIVVGRRAPAAAYRMSRHFACAQ